MEYNDDSTDVEMKDEEMEKEAAQQCPETIMRWLKRDNRKAAWLGRPGRQHTRKIQYQE